MLEKSFGLFYFLKQPKNQKKDERYVYMRITVDGVAREVSTKMKWSPDRWDQSTGKAVGNKEDARTLNARLDAQRQCIYTYKNYLSIKSKVISADNLKRMLLGMSLDEDSERTLLGVFKDHNDKMASLIGKEYAAGTYQRYRTSYDHTKSFIKWKYGTDDIALVDLKYEFISEYAYWFKAIRNCAHNSTMKYIANFKKIVLDCIKKGWIERDPFISFKTTKKEVVRVALTNNELSKMANKNFVVDRLRQVRDIFLFCCYTGLAYIDVKNLKRIQIIKGIDGEDWIITKRQKTDSPTRLPLLPVALEIMNKYKDHPKCKDEGYVLPVLTNQKMNSYLKEIADSCGINKDLTFHIARHTFATTVLLSNGVPIESVSKMLGHKSIRQTQQYAKILDMKISSDMQLLKTKLANIP